MSYPSSVLSNQIDFLSNQISALSNQISVLSNQISALSSQIAFLSIKSLSCPIKSIAFILTMESKQFTEPVSHKSLFYSTASWNCSLHFKICVYLHLSICTINSSPVSLLWSNYILYIVLNDLACFLEWLFAFQENDCTCQNVRYNNARIMLHIMVNTCIEVLLRNWNSRGISKSLQTLSIKV